MADNAVGVHEWYNQTTINPLGLIATIALGVVLVMAPRRFTVAPMVVLACFIPSAQRLVIAGADFDLLRILVLFAWARLTIRNEFQGFVWNRLDTMVVAWKISGTLIQTLAFGSLSVFINRCGWMFDGFGMYFFFRCMLRDWRDIDFTIRTFILIAFPVAVAFCVERATGRNVFSTFGGVPEFTVVREGKLRCQGAYAHAILAGCFWVGVMPMMVSQIVSGRKWLGAMGIASGIVVVINCASSTPILAVACMFFGMLLYRIRAHLRQLRWSFFFLLVLLHCTMEKPVWHLLSRVNIVGGSTGWHRYKIVDATINNFSEWWLLGETNVMGWGVWQMRDPTNQYIVEALRGGLLTVVCFILMISVAFGLVGRALPLVDDDTSKRVLVWSFGAALFVHVCSFFSVFYFGQIMMLWYLTLAMIGSLPGLTRASKHQAAIPVPNGFYSTPMNLGRRH